MSKFRGDQIFAIIYSIMVSIWVAGVAVGLGLFLTAGAVSLSLFALGAMSIPIALLWLIWKKVRSISEHGKS